MLENNRGERSSMTFVFIGMSTKTIGERFNTFIGRFWS